MLAGFTSGFDDLKKLQDNCISTIVWDQTLETITFKIDNNKNQIQFSDHCFSLCKPTQTISLTLFDRICTEKCNINQTDNTITFLKTIFRFWPHLFSRYTDQEVVSQLRESDFFIQIDQKVTFDTLDFDLVISGQGQKTGLE